MQNNGTGIERGQSDKGQTVVEFALVASFLFLIVFGIVEFSRIFFAYATMSHGVREAARYGIVTRAPVDELETLKDEIEALALSRMLVIGGTATVTVDYPDTDSTGYPLCPHECRITVHATSAYNSWVPFVPDFEMIAQSTMHME